MNIFINSVGDTDNEAKVARVDMLGLENVIDRRESREDLRNRLINYWTEEFGSSARVRFEDECPVCFQRQHPLTNSCITSGCPESARLRATPAFLRVEQKPCTGVVRRWLAEIMTQVDVFIPCSGKPAYGDLHIGQNVEFPGLRGEAVNAEVTALGSDNYQALAVSRGVRTFCWTLKRTSEIPGYWQVVWVYTDEEK